jgi:hypothetical protein
MSWASEGINREASARQANLVLWEVCQLFAGGNFKLFRWFEGGDPFVIIRNENNPWG